MSHVAPFSKLILYHRGTNVLKYPGYVKDAYNAGHSIGIHTWSHTSFFRLTVDEIVAEIVWTARIVYDLTGEVPVFVRPPCRFLSLA